MRPRPVDRVDSALGPDLQPMSEHLANTPITRIQELLLCVAVVGLLDDDDALILGEDAPWFDAMLSAIGLSPEAALALKVRWCRNELNLARFGSWELHAGRFETKAARSQGEAVSRWQSWSDTA